jgi:hypothetical protein
MIFDRLHLDINRAGAPIADQLPQVDVGEVGQTFLDCIGPGQRHAVSGRNEYPIVTRCGQRNS